MSTRSVIVVTGKNNRWGNYNTTYRLYKHCDGYPSGNLPLIADALKVVVKEVNEENKHYKRNFNDLEIVRPAHLTGKLIGAASSPYGMGAILEHESNAEFKPSDLGNQWDVEYTYIIDLDKKVVSVYAGSFSGGIQAGYANGTIPLWDTDTQATELKEIKKAVTAIKRIGFTIAKAGIKPAKFTISKGKGLGKPDFIITRG